MNQAVLWRRTSWGPHLDRPLAITCASMLLTTLLGGSGLAQAILLQSHGGDPTRDNFSGSVSWEFVMEADGDALELGYVDAGGDGLNISHEIGLYSSGGSLLASVTVPAGLAGTPREAGDETWRFSELSSPIALTAGSTYRLAAEVISGSGDPWGDSDPGNPDSLYNAILTDQVTNPIASNWIPDGGAGVEYPTNALTPPHLNKNYGAANIFIDSTALGVPGDVDGDGDVDLIELDNDMISDFDIIRDNFFNTGVPRSQGDLTGEGDVTIADFNQWRANFAGPGTVSFSDLFGDRNVPEPTSSALVAVLVLAWPLARQRR